MNDENDGKFIAERLRSELKFRGISGAEAARRIGEKDDNRVRQVLNGRQRLSAEMLARLCGIGVDGQFVLTGDRSNGISVRQVASVMQMISDAEYGQQLARGDFIKAVCALLETAQTTGVEPDNTAVISVLAALR